MPEIASPNSNTTRDATYELFVQTLDRVRCSRASPLTWRQPRLADRPQNPYGPLRDLVRPYILRRMKTALAPQASLPHGQAGA